MADPYVDSLMNDDRDPETKMVDLSGPDVVEVTVSEAPDGFKVWVNVNGVCRFRAYRAKRVITEILSDGQRIMKIEKIP